MNLSRAVVFTLAFAVLAPSALVVGPQRVLASNAFCGADASYVPWNASANAPTPPGSNAETGMRVLLYTSIGSMATALVTFVTNDEAYQASVATRMHPSPGGGDEVGDAVLVTFPKPVDVQYAYVDSYSLDGSPLVSCPSFVNQVYPLRGAPRPNSAMVSLHQIARSESPSLPAHYATSAAALLQTLPSLACGVAYKPPHMGLMPQSDWSAQDEMSSVDSGRAGTSAVIAIYLTADGKPISTQLVRSSGNSITDNEGLDQAKSGSYTAAEFLCTPVVSLLFMAYHQK